MDIFLLLFTNLIPLYVLIALGWISGRFFDVDRESLGSLAIVPPAANIAAFAAQLDMKPEKAATTVLLGTLVALFTIPLMLALSGLFN